MYILLGAIREVLPMSLVPLLFSITPPYIM